MDFVSKRYASDPPVRDSMNKLLQQKLAEHDENSEEFILYLQENYTKSSVSRVVSGVSVNGVRETIKKKKKQTLKTERFN